MGSGRRRVNQRGEVRDLRTSDRIAGITSSNWSLGMTQEQWNYKTIDTVWSIAEISEHLEKSEMQLFNLVKDQLQASPANLKKQDEAKEKTQSGYGCHNFSRSQAKDQPGTGAYR